MEKKFKLIIKTKKLGCLYFKIYLILMKNAEQTPLLYTCLALNNHLIVYYLRNLRNGKKLIKLVLQIQLIKEYKVWLTMMLKNLNGVKLIQMEDSQCCKFYLVLEITFQILTLQKMKKLKKILQVQNQIILKFQLPVNRLYMTFYQSFRFINLLLIIKMDLKCIITIQEQMKNTQKQDKLQQITKDQEKLNYKDIFTQMKMINKQSYKHLMKLQEELLKVIWQDILILMQKCLIYMINKKYDNIYKILKKNNVYFFILIISLNSYLNQIQNKFHSVFQFFNNTGSIQEKIGKNLLTDFQYNTQFGYFLAVISSENLALSEKSINNNIQPVIGQATIYLLQIILIAQKVIQILYSAKQLGCLDIFHNPETQNPFSYLVFFNDYFLLIKAYFYVQNLYCQLSAIVSNITKNTQAENKITSAILIAVNSDLGTTESIIGVVNNKIKNIQQPQIKNK